MIQPKAYREELFQWIWQNLEFDCSGLQTECGQPLEIIDPGKPNHGKGPDFLQAHLYIEEKEWYGSVEIHKTTNEWNRHNHHLDPSFNSVVLHVVYEHDSCPGVNTQDGSTPFTLVLKPVIHRKLHQLLEAKKAGGIPCGGNISFINQKAFERQVLQAHKEYFEFKIDELLAGYDASLPLSKAWTNCLLIQAYKTLGIPANRQQMGKLACELIGKNNNSPDAESFISWVEQVAFGEKSSKRFGWKYSGMRPASRPQPRVRQAASLHRAIVQYPFQRFLKESPGASWKHLIDSISPAELPGSSRLHLLKQIVYLPALYLLGDLLHSKRLKGDVLESWRATPQKVPQEVQKPFKKAGFEVNRFAKVLGLAHQYKRYCKKRNCHRCEVFKTAIHS